MPGVLDNDNVGLKPGGKAGSDSVDPKVRRQKIVTNDRMIERAILVDFPGEIVQWLYDAEILVILGCYIALTHVVNALLASAYETCTTKTLSQSFGGYIVALQDGRRDTRSDISVFSESLYPTSDGICMLGVSLAQ